MEARTETTKSCCMKDCKRPYRAKGYCNIHYKKWRRGELEAKPRYRICGEENCKKPTFKGGMCEQHHSAWSASKKGVTPEAPAAAPAAAPEAVAEAKPAEVEEKPAAAPTEEAKT